MKKTVIYITYPNTAQVGQNAFGVYSPLVVDTFKRLGLRTITIETDGNKREFFSNLLLLMKSGRSANYVYIAVDGRSALEKYSLIKLLFPHLKLIWEFHAPCSEVYWFDHRWRDVLRVKVRTMRRKLLASLVSECVCMTLPLAKYAAGMGIQNVKVIGSYVDLKVLLLKKTTTLPHVLLHKVIGDDCLYVYWGGGANLPWQAIDLIEKVAMNIYALDKKIVFIVAGSDRWHTFAFDKNVLFLGSRNYQDYLEVVRMSHVCLALYRTDSLNVTGLDFYFSPRKIVEYMACGKTVIASDTRTIRTFIRDGENGLITNNTVGDIVNKIMMLRRHPATLIRLGKKARQSVSEKHTIDQAVGLFSEVFCSNPIPFSGL